MFRILAFLKLSASINEKIYDIIRCIVKHSSWIVDIYKLLHRTHFTQKKQITITWLEQWHIFSPEVVLKVPSLLLQTIHFLYCAICYITLIKMLCNILKTTSKNRDCCIFTTCSMLFLTIVQDILASIRTVYLCFAHLLYSSFISIKYVIFVVLIKKLFSML